MYTNEAQAYAYTHHYTWNTKVHKLKCQQFHILHTKVMSRYLRWCSTCARNIFIQAHVFNRFLRANTEVHFDKISLYNTISYFLKSQFLSGTLLYLEVSQSCFGQRDIFHQEAAVFHWYIWRVQDVDLSCENDSRVWKITVSSFFWKLSNFP